MLNSEISYQQSYHREDNTEQRLKCFLTILVSTVSLQSKATRHTRINIQSYQFRLIYYYFFHIKNIFSKYHSKGAQYMGADFLETIFLN